MQIRTKKEKKNTSMKPALIYAETHQQLKELSAETGIPMVRLVDICVKFAIEHIEVIEE